MDRSFELFLGRVNARFRSIARATKGEKELGDLQNDSWLIADEIGRRRGRAVDFSDPVDEGLVIGAIVARNIKWGDWRMRKSVRIDQGCGQRRRRPRLA